MKFRVLAMIALGAAGIAGCDVYVHPHPVAVEVDAGAPVVYDSYYTGGYYEGGFWVWHDHDGHLFRERREFHEHRMADREHRAVEHHEAVRHEEEHHEEHH